MELLYTSPDIEDGVSAAERAAWVSSVQGALLDALALLRAQNAPRPVVAQMENALAELDRLERHYRRRAFGRDI
jgi:hypothetical protein